MHAAAGEQEKNNSGLAGHLGVMPCIALLGRAPHGSGPAYVQWPQIGLVSPARARSAGFPKIWALAR